MIHRVRSLTQAYPVLRHKTPLAYQREPQRGSMAKHRVAQRTLCPECAAFRVSQRGSIDAATRVVFRRTARPIEPLRVRWISLKATGYARLRERTLCCAM